MAVNAGECLVGVTTLMHIPNTESVKKTITWISLFQHYDLRRVLFREAEQNIAEFPSQFDVLECCFAVVVYLYT